MALFAANFLLQRISIPTLSIPIITPLIVIWMGIALWFGVVDLHARRLMLWLAASAVSAALVLLQVLLISNPYVSVNSWLFWMVTWLPVVVQFRDRGEQTYLRALRGIGHLGIVIGTLSGLFMIIQLFGVRYRDLMGQLVPASLLVDGYVITYPVTWGSPIFKSNAWVALEPSFLSFMLGICLISAVIARLHWVKLIIILVGLLATAAASGLAVVAVFIVLCVLLGQGRLLRPYALPTIPIALIFGTTLFGQSILNRLTEFGDSRSSTSLRAIEPYLYLWPEWIADPWVPFIGHGPGSSAWVVTNSGIGGLLVPSPAKVIFDYGLIGGTLLLLVMVAAFVRCPDPKFAMALAISILTVQGASPPLVVSVIIAVTLWSPGRLGPPTDPADPRIQTRRRPARHAAARHAAEVAA